MGSSEPPKNSARLKAEALRFFLAFFAFTLSAKPPFLTGERPLPLEGEVDLVLFGDLSLGVPPPRALSALLPGGLPRRIGAGVAAFFAAALGDPLFLGEALEGALPGPFPGDLVLRLFRGLAAAAEAAGFFFGAIHPKRFTFGRAYLGFRRS